MFLYLTVNLILQSCDTKLISFAHCKFINACKAITMCLKIIRNVIIMHKIFYSIKNILCIIKVLLWILASEKPGYLVLVTYVWDSGRTLQASITSNYAFSLNRASCAKDRISECPPLLSPFAFLAFSAFPVTCTCAFRYERRAPNARGHHSCQCMYALIF